MTYRTGRHLGRTIYRVTGDGQDELIGIMDTPGLGELVVEALNARERVLGANPQVGGRATVPPSQSLLLPHHHNAACLSAGCQRKPQAGGPSAGPPEGYVGEIL